MSLRHSALAAMRRTGIDQKWFALAYAAYARLENRIRRGDWFFPRAVTIEIIEPCNRKCPYCPVSLMPPRTGKMEFDLFRRILDELVALRFAGTIEYSHYNEPTLDPRLPQFIFEGKDRLPASIHRIHSNGDFLTPGLYAKLDAAGIDQIIVTDHDNLPGKGERYEDMAKVTFRAASEMHLYNRAGLMDIPQETEGRFYHALWTLLLRGCSESVHPIIKHDGRVIFCCHDGLEKTVIGNLGDNTLAEILAASAGMRRDASMGKWPLEMCAKCQDFSGAK